MDWTDSAVSELVEEREAGMSSLVVGFVMHMRK